MQSSIAKQPIDRFKWNSKIYSINPKVGIKEKVEEQINSKNKQKMSNKMVDRNPTISIKAIQR